MKGSCCLCEGRSLGRRLVTGLLWMGALGVLGSQAIEGADKAQLSPLPSVKGKIAVIAHRGGAGLGPENTLAAYRKAIDMGLDFVEIDVRETQDGRLYQPS